MEDSLCVIVGILLIIIILAFITGFWLIGCVLFLVFLLLLCQPSLEETIQDRKKNKKKKPVSESQKKLASS